MSLIQSAMNELGAEAADFRLPGTDGKLVSLADYEGYKGLLVIFMCNHCPYVKHISHALAQFANDYASSPIGIVGINSNDASTHPADSPEKMIEEVAAVGYRFPYLYDESQAVAKLYNATCTPDFFLFDEHRLLVYRGQFDASRPGSDVPVTGIDLRTAVNALLDGREPAKQQIPSVGCSIKWKAGNAPL